MTKKSQPTGVERKAALNKQAGPRSPSPSHSTRGRAEVPGPEQNGHHAGWLRGGLSRLGIALPSWVALAGVLWTSACGDGATEPAPPDPPRATTVTVTPATAQLSALSATVQLSAQVLDQNGRAMAGAAVAWSSGNATIATVNASGLVTAVQDGTATITATSGSARGSAAVTVMQSPDSVALMPEEETITALGDTLRLAAAAFDANGHAVAGAAFSWESSDDAVATVDGSGLVTAVQNGTATITATSGSARGSAAVTVMQSPDSVALMPEEETITALGDTLRLAAAAFDANGHAVAGAAFSWESSDDAVATVDSSGLVTRCRTELPRSRRHRDPRVGARP